MTYNGLIQQKKNGTWTTVGEIKGKSHAACWVQVQARYRGTPLPFRVVRKEWVAKQEKAAA